MTDIEITKRCAEKMEYAQIDNGTLHLTEDEVDLFHISVGGLPFVYDPLHDDAQAMALVKKCELELIPPYLRATHMWRVRVAGRDDNHFATSSNLNRAIVECVAKIQQAKQEGGR